MADMSAVERGEYPIKQRPLTKKEKWVYGAMLAYSFVIYFQIATYYVWGGQ